MFIKTSLVFAPAHTAEIYIMMTCHWSVCANMFCEVPLK